jgi:GNAT superfamily N-acetyltransferase
MIALDVRLLDAGDIKQITEEFAAAGINKPVSLYERYLAEQCRGERVVLAAFQEDVFGGSLTIKWASDYPPFKESGIPEIVDFNVLPQVRRQGVGSLLMDEAEQRILRMNQAFTEAVPHNRALGLALDGAAGAAWLAAGELPEVTPHDAEALHTRLLTSADGEAPDPPAPGSRDQDRFRSPVSSAQRTLRTARGRRPCLRRAPGCAWLRGEPARMPDPSSRRGRQRRRPRGPGRREAGRQHTAPALRSIEAESRTARWPASSRTRMRRRWKTLREIHRQSVGTRLPILRRPQTPPGGRRPGAPSRGPAVPGHRRYLRMRHPDSLRHPEAAYLPGLAEQRPTIRREREQPVYASL